MPDTQSSLPAVPKAWPFEEARKVAERLARTGKSSALFETGYGPSGLPHIGTFGEVARTSWVRHAFTELTGLPSKLLAFSDDMDGLRKVPDNVPNREMLAQHLGKPLTRIPDPFGTHPSFGAHNNARLRSFLDSFGFAYEFASSSEYYASGRFDAALLRVLERHDEILAVILPTLGAERRASYSPFLPIHPKTGIVMQVKVEKLDPAAGTIAWRDPDTEEWFETLVTGGAAKLQWKADWAMRWHALGVDYEMSGKDLIDSVKLSGRICRILGSEPPTGFTYELFLDEQAQKISKSKGNGLSVEEWLRYAPPESLGQFMFNQPQRAKRLYFDVIPRAVDEYLANAARAHEQEGVERAANPAWHIHAGQVPQEAHSPLSFAMLLNLASVVNAETPDILWGFIRRYNPQATPEDMPFLARLVEYALAYYRDFVRPAKQFREPDATERAALQDLAEGLRALPADAPAEDIQTLLYDVGKRHPFPELRAWFGCLYQVLLGQQEGPRFGQFIALYGIPETITLIETALARTPA
ncbi:Lysine--tRNA ligase [Rhodovastum atsumiense]|uniref:Lysine--tRNA ligase n=1 Tax=Rhodovastum atsumiense TaxID=504468 RepID=A0A5M6IR49_9PROT|nr:lysine--tRNA ligase [Rhodovastum atsumiense]KAA5610764.1 lysine--tRNA ligase [Rhodovastum atsumiense]CAH2604427.1 Lysine--tRNA ligase [Rhodovastum atsumiense]